MTIYLKWQSDEIQQHKIVIWRWLQFHVLNCLECVGMHVCRTLCEHIKGELN